MTAAADGWRCVLTDVTENRHLEFFRVAAADLGLPGSWTVTVDTLRGGRQEGVNRVVVDTAAVRLVVLPTRGMNVYEVRCGDLRLGWDSPSAEIVHPRHVDLAHRGGLGWLEGFNEWLVRCGLEFAGHPGTDVIVDNVGNISEVDLTLHGRVGHIPARHVELRVDRSPPHRIRLVGIIDERSFYGPRLRLRTELSIVPGETSWRIRDSLTNIGAAEQEFQLIYHANYGPPLLGAGAEAVIPTRRVAPMNAKAAGAIAERATYRGPTPGFVEEVFLIEPYGDADGVTTALLRDAEGLRAVTTTWNLAELPYLTQWKNTTSIADGYVTGIEPGTSYPFNRRIERAAGRVPKLAPGETRTFTLAFAVHRGTAEVAAAAARVRALTAGRPTEVIATPPEIQER